MSSPAAVRGQAVRGRLLSAAVELISERGWSGVSTRILAQRAGVSASVVHYHFSSVDVLLREAVVGVIARVVSELDAVLARVETPVEAVEMIFATAEEYTGADAPTLAGVEAILAAGRDVELRDRIGAVFEEFRHRFGSWLAARGVAAGDDTAAVVVAAVDGLVLQRCAGVQLSSGAAVAVVRRLVTVEEE